MKINKVKENLQSYLLWPVVLGILLAIMDIHMFFINITAGVIGLGYLVVYLVLAVLLYMWKRGKVQRDLVDYAMRYNATFNQVGTELTIPFAVVDSDYRCVWENNRFKKLFSEKLPRNHGIFDAIASLTEESFPKSSKSNEEIHFRVSDVYYKAVLQRISLKSVMDTQSDVFHEDVITEKQMTAVETDGTDVMYAIFVYDESDIVLALKEVNDQRLDIGMLYIDNYEETLAAVDDVRRSLLTALVDRKINKYMLKIDAVIRKLEKDKYIFMFQHKYLSALQKDKFSILDEIRAINATEDAAITISIGIGTQIDTFLKRQEYSRSAIDLALARGGDQVVIKSKDNLQYYGGKSVQQEKNTRVKARVKAHALRESIEAAERIVIMGHSMPDADAIGSAIGIYTIAKALDKPAKIVVNQVTSSIASVVDMFRKNKDYPSDMFVKTEEAINFIGDKNGSLLIVVDVNKPSYTDAPELIPLAGSIVVIDHHRQSEEYFENPTLSYVEPFASSACEMVAEILQYVGDEIHVKTAEADALYSGIMIDTNNFMNKPGVRTFEAVAFLRRCGADIFRIRKMFRTDLIEYKVRAEAIQNMESFMGCYAIAPCNAEQCVSPTIVGAKIADTLLDIDGMKASFVLTMYNDRIYISARSIDELNVQVVMERLGGGGHIYSAGAQLVNSTMEQAIQKLKSVLIRMKEEGDI